MEAVREEYESEASFYDTKWGRYVEATTSEGWSRVRPFVSENSVVLDVGCGTGALFHRMKQDGFTVARMIGVDLSPNMLTVAKKKVPDACFLEGSASDGGMTCVRDGSVDVAVTTSSFHFWTDPVAGLAEIHKKMRPGGMVVIIDWNHEYWWCKLLGVYLWMRGFPGSSFYTSDEAAKMTELAGFEVLFLESFVTLGWGMFCVFGTKRQ